MQAPDLLARLVARFDTCHVVIVDYGDEARTLYAPERFPNGTLACHRRHGSDRAYYEDVGAKDITAHVNFTALASTLADQGFTVDTLRSQATFLIDNGLIDQMAATKADAVDPFERMQSLMRAKQLFHPDAMGESFRVLTARRERRDDAPMDLP
jgi:SAM-dependent MidA family methyltransferase